MSDVIYRLLHHFSYRQHFLSGRIDLLKIQNESLVQLQTIDNTELERTANKIIHNFLYGGSASEGGIMRSFSRTFKLLEERGAEPFEIGAKFMESHWYDKYQETTFSSCGVSVEEAFYQYICAFADSENDPMGLRFCVEHEFLIALMSILVLNENPGFEIESFHICTNGACRFIIKHYPAHYLSNAVNTTNTGDGTEMVAYLYAATPHKLVHGPISQLIETAIHYRSKAKAISTLSEASQNTPVEKEDWQQLVDDMVQMGLLCH